VDTSVEKGAAGVVRLGLVVPKRHARRAVTRTLVKNQLRAGLRRRLADLAPGDWVLRLRAPVDRQRFPSARSEALASLLHGEIEQLLADAVRRSIRDAATARPPRTALPG
jgi:ribonuclease P protein component